MKTFVLRSLLGSIEQTTPSPQHKMHKQISDLYRPRRPREENNNLNRNIFSDLAHSEKRIRKTDKVAHFPRDALSTCDRPSVSSPAGHVERLISESHRAAPIIIPSNYSITLLPRGGRSVGALFVSRTVFEFWRGSRGSLWRRVRRARWIFLAAAVMRSCIGCVWW